MTLSSAQVIGTTDEHIHYYAINIGIHNQIVPAWQSMCEDAKKSGFELTIASGFRSFERQLSIWNRKFSGELQVKDINNNVIDISQLSEDDLLKAILTFSALPGGSRHHWGTDIDFYDKNALNNTSLQLESWEYKNKGPFAALTEWLEKHAQNYGFHFPYNKFRGGIAEEPWHLSYAPLAEQFEKQMKQETLVSCLSSTDILGKETIIKNIDYILSTYILNVGHIKNG